MPPPPASQEPAGELPSPGTHMLLEMALGSTTFGAGGVAAAGLFGLGGRPPGTPLRLYAVFEMAFQDSSTQGQRADLDMSWSERRRSASLVAGGRAYIPVWGALRFFAEGLVGSSHISAQLDRDWTGPRRATGWRPCWKVGGGVQYRLLEHMSLGLRGQLDLGSDDVGGLRGLVGDQPLRSAAQASLTRHF